MLGTAKTGEVFRGLLGTARSWSGLRDTARDS
jgi:hypothetical protein